MTRASCACVSRNWASIFAFGMGKSTMVPLDPRDASPAPIVKLTYREFDSWARQNDVRRKDPAFFSRTDVHWTEKLSVLFSGSDAAGHNLEPSRSTTKLLLVDSSLILFLFVPPVRAMFEITGPGSLVFQLMGGLVLGQVVGRTIGGFYRWVRGRY